MPTSEAGGDEHCSKNCCVVGIMWNVERGMLII